MSVHKSNIEVRVIFEWKPASVDVQAMPNMLYSGVKPMEVAKKFGVSRATVYRYKYKGSDNG